MSKELSPLVNNQIFKGKYLAKYEFSTGETETYDAKLISLYSLLVYILFHCYYTAVACKTSHGISMAYFINSPWRILVGPRKTYYFGASHGLSKHTYRSSGWYWNSWRICSF